MKLKIEQRTQQEMQNLHMNLMGFLLDNPDYQYVETSEGILVVISPLKITKDSGIIAPKKEIIKP